MKKITKREREMFVGEVELLSYYESLATNVYVWDGLPENIHKFYPEQTLYRQGMACMIQLPGSDEYDIFPVAYGSVDLDYHGEPLSWRCYVMGAGPGPEMIRNTVYNAENSVLIWNNPTRTGLYPYVKSQVRNMLMTDHVIRINTLVQSTPVFITADGKNALTAKNLFAQFGIEDVVYGTDLTKNDMGFDVINLGVQFIGDKLSDQYETYNNRILRYLGINHLPVEKQERMLTGEIDSNDELIETIIKSRLDCRQQAADGMKDVFGLDVEVMSYSDELQQRDMERMQSTLSDGGENGGDGEENNSNGKED